MRRHAKRNAIYSYTLLDFCARAIGCADTPCVSAYAAHTADRPPRYVQAHTRRRV